MSLSAAHERLVRLSTAIALGRWEELRRLRGVAPPGEPDRGWREAVLQTHLFAGIPRLVEAYEVLDEVGGLGALEAGEEEELSSPAARERGRALFDRVYGRRSASVRARLLRLRPDFAGWIEEHAYGRVLSRPGLSPAVRELCAVAVLAALGQERQLVGHARGALSLGARREELLAALGACADLAGRPELERARRLIEHLGD
jgi:4-carboxymuconolactone decarboxylase